MQNRLGFFVMVATTISLCGIMGNSAPDYTAVYQSLPGGIEAIPGFTRVMTAALSWFGTWWLLCLGVAAGVCFGGPVLLRRSEGGQRFLDHATDWMSRYQFLVLALYVAFMFTLFWTIDLALHLPVHVIMEQLTGGG